MAVKLRLQRKGRKKAPFYHIVAADARAPRDGKYIERIGTYNPLTSPATININHDRALYWVMAGAQPTDTVRAILRFRGVNYRKHLQVGVNKGAITQEQADARYQEWMTSKDATIAARKESTRVSIEAHHRAIDGVAKIEPKEEVVVEKAAPAAEVVETVTEVVTETVQGTDEEVAGVEETTPPAE